MVEGITKEDEVYPKLTKNVYTYLEDFLTIDLFNLEVWLVSILLCGFTATLMKMYLSYSQL
jgi:hypothetical protein